VLRQDSTMVALALAALVACAAPRQPEERMTASRSVVYARHGMVASAHPLATRIGVDILERGGTAVDAAIAVNAALGFLEPVSCGVGGDLFAILWDPKTRKIHGLNGSGRAPLAARADLIAPEPNGTIPLFSPWSWTVPGAVDGWFALHGRFGRLRMNEILAPAIRAAEEGEPVPRVIADAWGRSERIFEDKPGFAATFLPGGRAPREGEIFRNPGLARTYRTIAEGGRDAFYRGPVAEGIDAFSRKVGGFLRQKDLAAHHSDWVEPISTSYRGVTLWELPPNGQGITALQMLNLLEGRDLKALGPASPDFWHLLVEAKKLAFEDRARFIADPAMAQVPLAGLLSKAYARERAKRIDLARAATEQPPGDPRFGEGDTTILAVADGEGMMVALIQSNYTGFGSGYAVEGWGFGLQDRGAQFDLAPGRPNSLAPGKRPFHTIIPALVTRDGKPWIAFGLMGGDMQPQGHVQILVNLVDLGMNLQEAGDAPRFYHTDSSEPTGTRMKDGGRLALEPAVPRAVREELARRGHRLHEVSTGAFGGYQAVARDPASGVLSGASESRKDGCAAGY
jgi:gamma-glutamyltranspeptidase / glutathione hydrolase